MRAHRIGGVLYTMIRYRDGAEVIVRLADWTEAQAMRDVLAPGTEIEVVSVSEADARLPLVVRRLAAAVDLDTAVPPPADFVRWLRDRANAPTRCEPEPLNGATVVPRISS